MSKQYKVDRGESDHFFFDGKKAIVKYWKANFLLHIYT